MRILSFTASILTISALSFPVQAQFQSMKGASSSYVPTSTNSYPCLQNGVTTPCNSVTGYNSAMQQSRPGTDTATKNSTASGTTDALQIVLDESDLAKAYEVLTTDYGVGKFSIEGPKQTRQGKKLGTDITLIIDFYAFSRAQGATSIEDVMSDLNGKLKPSKLCKGSLSTSGRFTDDGECSAAIGN